MDWFCSIAILLADAEVAKNVDDQGIGGLNSFLWLAMMLLAAYYLIVQMPQRREQDQRTKMIEGLKETDKVVTSSGIFATVTQVQKDSGRVTLRVDENNGTKIKVSLAAIAQVLGDENAEGDKK